MRPSDKVIPLLVTLALVILAFFFMVNEYESRIQLLEGALNETRDSLYLTTDNLIQALQQLELERALVTNGQGLRNFKSLEELRQFLSDDDTDQHEYIKDSFDCDDFARMLQERAFEKGYVINCQKLPVGGLNHMNNLALCGNDMYFIEADSDTVSYAGFLD